MGDTIRRLLGNPAGLDPGQYTTVGCGEIVAARVVLRCPECGGFDAIGAEHDIQADGRVVPSWKCPTVTCSASLWLVLDDWQSR